MYFDASIVSCCAYPGKGNTMNVVDTRPRVSYGIRADDDTCVSQYADAGCKDWGENGLDLDKAGSDDLSHAGALVGIVEEGSHVFVYVSGKDKEMYNIPEPIEMSQ